MTAMALRFFSRRNAACVLLLLTACAQAPSGDAAANASPAQNANTAQDEPTAAASPAQLPAYEANADAVRYANDDAGEPDLALPAAIVRALGTDERMLSCADGTRDGTSRFAADWVAARRIDLDDDGHADWIVNGRHACLREGDAAGWWVYADSGDAQRLLLRAAMATSLEVLGWRTQGFRDLRLQRAGDDVTVRYDGERYGGETPPPP